MLLSTHNLATHSFLRVNQRECSPQATARPRAVVCHCDHKGEYQPSSFSGNRRAMLLGLTSGASFQASVGDQKGFHDLPMTNDATGQLSCTPFLMLAFINEKAHSQYMKASPENLHPAGPRPVSVP
eukprot:scaffold23065_cov13-Tisochrysis_lutea.AAC.1